MLITKMEDTMPDKNCAFDPALAKEFCERYFTFASELKLLQTNVKELKDEFKSRKLDVKLISRIMRLVKVKLDVDKSNASPETVEQIEDLVKDQIGKVMD